MNYFDIEQKLWGKYRNKTSRKIANNTYLQRRGNGIALRLHDTDVVTYYHVSIVLNTDGFWTNVTKDRINVGLELAGIPWSKAHVFTDNRVWYVGHWDDPKPWTGIYADGITLDYEGNILCGIGEKPDRDSIRKRVRAIKARFDSHEMTDDDWELLAHALEYRGYANPYIQLDMIERDYKAGRTIDNSNLNPIRTMLYKKQDFESSGNTAKLREFCDCIEDRTVLHNTTKGGE